MKTIKVTEEDIIKGWNASAHYCPVALAAKRAFASEEITVGPEALFLKCNRFTLPFKAKLFITRFDAGEQVKPFSFRLT